MPVKAETVDLTPLGRPPAILLIEVVAARALLIILRSSALGVPVAPRTPSRQSLASTTSEPSTHVIVPGTSGTGDPKGISVGLAVMLFSMNGIGGPEEEPLMSVAMELTKPFPSGVGLGTQKYPSLQWAQAQPYPQLQFCAGVC